MSHGWSCVTQDPSSLETGLPWHRSSIPYLDLRAKLELSLTSGRLLDGVCRSAPLSVCLSLWGEKGNRLIWGEKRTCQLPPFPSLRRGGKEKREGEGGSRVWENFPFGLEANQEDLRGFYSTKNVISPMNNLASRTFWTIAFEPSTQRPSPSGLHSNPLTILWACHKSHLVWSPLGCHLLCRMPLHLAMWGIFCPLERSHHNFFAKRGPCQNSYLSRSSDHPDRGFVSVEVM